MDCQEWYPFWASLGFLIMYWCDFTMYRVYFMYPLGHPWVPSLGCKKDVLVMIQVERILCLSFTGQKAKPLYNHLSHPLQSLMLCMLQFLCKDLKLLLIWYNEFAYGHVGNLCHCLLKVSGGRYTCFPFWEWWWAEDKCWRFWTMEISGIT